MREICRRIFLYLKGHRVTALVVLALGAPASQFIYQFGSDFVEGRWASGGVDLYLHTERLWRSEPVYLFYSSPDLVGNQRVIVPVELLVRNDSDKAVKMVTLSLAYPSSAKRQLLPESAQFQTGDLMDKDVIHEVRARGGYTYSHYRMPFMPPRDSINFADGAFAAVVEGVGKSYQSYGSGLDLFASLSSETSARETWRLRYRAVSAGNTFQLRNWVEFDYAQRLAREIRERDGFWKYLWGWISLKKVTVFGFYPRFNFVPEAEVYIPVDNPDEYKRYRFSPYSYKLLLGVD